MTARKSGSAKRTDAQDGGANGPPSDGASRVPLPFPVVGIGGSAGGLHAFSQLFAALPPDTGMAFVVVSHLAPTHVSMLAEILGRTTAMPVTEAEQGSSIEANHIYVIPPNKDIVMRGGALRLRQRRMTHGQHRPIDVFFNSLAAHQGLLAIGVVLSGSATDGTLGLADIKTEGGITFAQDATAAYDSMPRSAVDAGHVDFELPPDAIAHELARIARHPLIASRSRIAEAGPAAPLAFQRIIDLLAHGTGVDFTQYRPSTLQRRLARRMIVHKVESVDDYADFIAMNPAEIDALFEDILIQATSFFRNPEAYAYLSEEVFPRLVQDRSPQEGVRVWVLGCSTGEEAYSIAIAFTEFLERIGRQVPLQIFATDLHGTSLERARSGIFPSALSLTISPERLQRFFTPGDGHYRISKGIRDMCVFARHDSLSDPPFSRIDLVTCRNVLIYFEPATQRRLLPRLHYALRSGGILWLGAAETIGPSRDLFDVVDARHRIFARSATSPRVPLSLPFGDRPERRGARAGLAPTDPRPAAAADVFHESDRLLLTRFAPPGILVRGNLEILQFRGNTAPFLTPVPGRASMTVPRMLRPELLVHVRSAVLRVQREGVPVRELDIRFDATGQEHNLAIEVLPVPGNDEEETCFLVLFDVRPREAAAPARRGGRRTGGESADVRPVDAEIARLRQELAASREYLQSVIEQQETAHEQLQSANEEVQSTNEELQSINEELETSKEELQSINEELATVNDELQMRNDDLGESNNDLLNLLASVQMAIVMLGSDLRIRRFTPAAERLLNLIPADVGRPITDIQLNLDIPDLDKILVGVVEEIEAKEMEVQDRLGHWYLLRVRPYRTVQSQILGVVMVLVDVDALKRSREERDHLAVLLDQSTEPLFVWEPDGTITFWSRGAAQLYGFTSDEALGRNVHEFLKTENLPELEQLSSALATDGLWTGELIHTTKSGGRIVVDSRTTMTRDALGRRLVLQTNQDVTDRKKLEADLRLQVVRLDEADRSKDEFLAMLAHELRTPLTALRLGLEMLAPQMPPELADRARTSMRLQIHNMARMVDDLLDVSRLTRGKVALHPEAVELRTLVERVVASVRPSVTADGQVLHVQFPAHPVYLSADPVRIEQILDNLLNNAARFTGPGGHIHIDVEVDEQASDGGPSDVTLQVCDDGAGIAPELLPHIFDLFVQGESPPEHGERGLGLGLTLVQQLVELHGGSVTAESDGLGHGATFTIRLPALEPARWPTAHRARRPVVRTKPPAPRRVLVVDDNPDIAEGQAALLRRAGHDVRVWHHGDGALEAALDFRPHVVLLDVGLPGMDGIAVARQLRAHSETAGALLVAISGYGSLTFRNRAREAGIDHYLVKPADPERVADLVARAKGDG